MAKSRKQPAGIRKFEDLMRGLVEVPKEELDAEVNKYKKRRAAKKAKSAKPKRPSPRAR